MRVHSEQPCTFHDPGREVASFLLNLFSALGPIMCAVKSGTVMLRRTLRYVVHARFPGSGEADRRRPEKTRRRYLGPSEAAIGG